MPHHRVDKQEMTLNFGEGFFFPARRDDAQRALLCAMQRCLS